MMRMVGEEAMKIMNDLNENDDKLAVGYLDYRLNKLPSSRMMRPKYVLCIQFSIISDLNFITSPLLVD